jgi:hypothetical protein
MTCEWVCYVGTCKYVQRMILIFPLRHFYAGISEHIQEIVDVMRGVASKG